jgi:fucose 4-O-acetylase-like acetyltransferase
LGGSVATLRGADRATLRARQPVETSPIAPSIRPQRLPGADLLRLASLLSIVLFHIVLRDAQVAARTGPPPEIFDALLCISSVFDNRSIAILSLFLLIKRHADTPRPIVIAERARRLLLPYLAWSLIYPLLDLAVAGIAGQPGPVLARIGHGSFWLSGLLLATSTGHLHFLPTLFVLTVICTVFRPRLPLGAVAALLAATSALRAAIEFLVLSGGDAGSTPALGALSVARLVEYLPLGMLAAAIAASPPLRPQARAVLGLAVVILLGCSIGVEPAFFAGLGQSASLLCWAIAQAMLGALIVALAAYAVLTITAGDTARMARVAAGTPWFARYALGLFLIHPFVSSLLDVLIGAPGAYDVAMVLPKFLIVIAGSFLATWCLLRNRWLATLV